MYTKKALDNYSRNFKKMNLNGKSVLITGGTGSLGRALTETILKHSPKN